MSAPQVVFGQWLPRYTKAGFIDGRSLRTDFAPRTIAAVTDDEPRAVSPERAEEIKAEWRRIAAASPRRMPAHDPHRAVADSNKSQILVPLEGTHE